MGFLAVHVAFNVAFALSTRVAQARGYDFFLVTTVNYLTAFLAAMLWATGQPDWVVDGQTVVFGLMQGTQYALTIVGIYFLLIRSGVGITFTLVRLAVVIPILVSVVAFGERPSALAVLGIGLMILSLPLLAGRSNSPADGRPAAGSFWPALLGLLLITGVGLSASKAFNELSTPAHRPAFIVLTFAASVPVALATFGLRRRLQPSAAPLAVLVRAARRQARVRHVLLASVANGVAMGAANVLQLTFFVLALRTVPGTIAFPIQTSVAVLLTTSAGWLIWRERYGPRALAGVATAVGGLVLANV